MQLSNRTQRRLARAAHRDAIRNKAEQNPELFAKGLLLHPDLLRGIRNIEDVFSILLNKGQQDILEALLRTPGVAKGVKSILASVLLIG